MTARRVIWVFLDGVGLGEPDSTTNPLVARALPHLNRLAGDQAWSRAATPVRQAEHVFTPLEVTLGMDGLPQSGTGQATLFTGVDCVAAAGRHWGPFPHTASIPIIREQNVFTRLARHGRAGQFVNAYPERYFRAVAPRERWTVTTRCCVEAGVPLRTETDLRQQRAIAADLTGASWRALLGLDVPVITPVEAGHRLARLAHDADLTLFEYYLTDKAGHSRDRARAGAVLQQVDAFLGGLIERMHREADLLLITSDHGNIEDLSHRAHTVNPVPLIALGPGAERFARAADLTDVTPLVVEALLGG